MHNCLWAALFATLVTSAITAVGGYLTHTAVHNVSFIVPVHVPKFVFLARLLASNDEHLNAVDILPIFTSEDESAHFALAFPLALQNRSVLRPLVYGGAPELLDKHPVFYKKFWAVYNLTNQYAFFAILDAEVEFVRHVDVEQLFQRYYLDKLLFGGSVAAA